MKYENIVALIKYLSCTFFILFASCKKYPKQVERTLKLSGKNKIELEKVIQHYQEPSDSLKLKAAYFLIGNMRNKYYYAYDSIKTGLFDYLNENRTDIYKPGTAAWDNSQLKMGETFDSLIPKYYSFYSNAMADAKSISSQVLIENIDLAIEVWKKTPWQEDYTFDEFCEYVLPYRNHYDIPEQNRAEMYDNYKWMLDKSNSSENFVSLTKQLNDSLDSFEYYESYGRISSMTLSDVHNLKQGVCTQFSSLKIGILRSLGIPAVQLNAHLETAWVGIPDTNGKFLNWEWKNSPSYDDLPIDEQRGQKFSKVFMKSFEVLNNFPENYAYDKPDFFLDNSRKDVTDKIIPTGSATIEITNSHLPDEHVFLCVISKNNHEISPIDWSKIEKGTALFNKLGLERIYFPFFYRDGEYISASVPFYLAKSKEISFLKPSKNRVKHIFRRKSPLNYPEHHFANLMVGASFQCSNQPDFKKYETLYTIKNKPFYKESGKSAVSKAYKYYRYFSPDSISTYDDAYKGIHVAEIEFLNSEGVILKGNTIVSEKGQSDMVKNAFDGDIRSNFDLNHGGWIGMAFENPVVVDSVKYLFRNSFNSIEPGDNYSLYYWDSGWKLIERKKATKDYIVFDAPENAVLLLKNISKGKVNKIFIYKNGKQIFG
ncbi:hypothetical protein [Maribacter aquivivus]|uniref:hypothetical protein n=1 Tax=Maribacter aquivivus TaxID=228958 RepID=UPI002491D602|nr:hypothetical protein [Maribacter aquivivus]